MKMKKVLALVWATLLGCVPAQRSIPVSAPVQASGLVINLSVAEDANRTARLDVVNSTNQAIAVGSALGFNGVYFDIELRADDGRIDASAKELFTRPRAHCIQPGKTFSLQIPLLHPPRLFDSNPVRDDFRYAVLQPGTYEARVVYRSPPVPLKGPCQPTVGEAASEWVRFSVYR